MGKANVRQLYRDALAGLDPFAEQVARKQMEMFGKLGCLPKQVEAVAPLFGVPPEQGALTKVPKILLFTGHRIDAPDRAKPRFPASQEATGTRRDLQDGQGGDGREPGAGDRDCRRRKRRGSFVSGSVRRTRHRAADVPRDPARRVCKSSVAPSGPNWISGSTTSKKRPPAALTSNPRPFPYGFRTGRIMVSGSGRMPGCFTMRWCSAEPTRP